MHSICQQIWKTQHWPQDWKRSIFIPIPKKSNAKECSNYCTIALISHASKVMLKILQARLQQYVNQELPYVSHLEKAEETEIKLPTSVGSLKKQESSRKTSISALLTMPKPLTVWITTNWKILQEEEIPGHLRNLYAGHEATFRTRHGTKDCFQIVNQVYSAIKQKFFKIGLTPKRKYPFKALEPKGDPTIAHQILKTQTH